MIEPGERIITDRRRSRSSVWSALAATALLLASSTPRAAAQTAASAVTRAQAERWADKEVAEIIRKEGATAAGAAVVCGGQVLFSHSYGWFDPVKKIPIDSFDQYDIGSVTKTFVGLVIAQLHSEGKIRSLDDPVNRYLKRIHLPSFEGQEVTIRELATHSAGLESPGFGISSGDQVEVPATSKYLRRKMVHIVRRPGFRSVYANWGPPILGAMAEDITGERFDRLVDRLLLKPLGMTATILSYDPTCGPRLVYAGITHEGPVRYAPRTPNTPFMAPAGSIQTTPDDMARYMNALLGHAQNVLSHDVLSMEQAPLMANYPGLSPIGLGVFLDPWNGYTTVNHSGLIAGYQCTMLVVPSRDFGAFVVYAGGYDPFGGGPANAGRAVTALLSEVLGPVVPLPPKASSSASDLSSYAGRYWLELRAHTTPEVLFGMDRMTEVEAATGGGLLIGSEMGKKEQYFEVAPGLFQGPVKDGGRPTLYAFEPGRLLMDKLYSTKVSGLGDPRNFKRLAFILLAGALLGILGVSVPSWKRFPHLASALAAVAVGYAIAWPILKKTNIDLELFYGRAWRFHIGTVAALIFLVAGLAGILVAVRTFQRRDQERRALLRAVHGWIVAISSLGLVWLAHVVHLI